MHTLIDFPPPPRRPDETPPHEAIYWSIWDDVSPRWWELGELEAPPAHDAE